MNFSATPLSRLRNQRPGQPSTPATPQEPDPAAKGVYQGNCNRTACQQPGATWYNHATRLYYCGSCAALINQGSNTADNLRLLGQSLVCTKGENIPPTT